ncbi:BrnT family toxin [Candidatus Nitrospira nitrificans]|uniref:BrnT family toxin n=1 Tax=Candidatus Nitrospira nitrificans TaxID=1742973 RepID=UPI000B83F402
MFTWDIGKAISNFEKHGVPFEEATTIFGDPNAMDGEDPAHSLHELRRQRIGRSVAGRILFVAYTVRRSDHEKPTIRIISARQSSRKERQAYARLAD